MNNDNMYNSFNVAYQESLSDIQSMGYKSNPRNRPSKELLGYSYSIENPKDRIIDFKARNLNPFYLIGNLLWVLKQSNKLDIIQYYNDKGSNFSDDGEILRGAYGKRIFDFDGVNQWHQVKNELKLNPESRRAMITINLPQHDWTGSLDTPCTSNIHFFIRNNQLHMINNMRSQSAAFVMPYDVFLMTMLQELMANELEVEVGFYQHNADSFHYFMDEEEKVNELIESKDYGESMPDMPKQNNMDEIKRLLRFEEYARNTNQKSIYLSDLRNTLYSELLKLRLSNYWFYFGEVLIARAIFDKVSKDEYKLFVGTRDDNPFKKLMLNMVSE